VLLTRPEADSRAIAERLEARGFACLIWPLTRIVPLAEHLELPAGVEALLVTSAHGLGAFAALSPRRDLPVLTVGARTAKRARALGFTEVASANGGIAALADLARARGHRHYLYPRGREVAGDLGAALAGSGQRVSETVLYAAEEAGPPPAKVAAALAAGRIGRVTVWSRRNAAILARHLAAGLAARLEATTLVAISPAAAAPLAEAGFARVVIAERPDAAAMEAALLEGRHAPRQ